MTKEDIHMLHYYKNSYLGWYLGHKREDIITHEYNKPVQVNLEKDIKDIFRLLGKTGEEANQFIIELNNNQHTKKSFMDSIVRPEDVVFDEMSNLDKMKKLISYIIDKDTKFFESDLDNLNLDEFDLVLSYFNPEYYHCLNLNDLILDYKIGDYFFISYLIAIKDEVDVKTLYWKTQDFKKEWAVVEKKNKLCWLFDEFKHIII